MGRRATFLQLFYMAMGHICTVMLNDLHLSVISRKGLSEILVSVDFFCMKIFICDQSIIKRNLVLELVI